MSRPNEEMFIPFESGTAKVQTAPRGGDAILDSGDSYNFKYNKNGTVHTILSAPDADEVTVPATTSVDAGVVLASVVKFDVTDGHDAAVGTSTGTIELPAGALIIDIQIQSTVLWNSGTSDLMTVGDDDDPNGWFDVIDLQSGGDLLVGESVSAGSSGPSDAGNSGRWAASQGAYLVAATGRMGRTTAGVDSGNYLGAATEVIGFITSVGTVPTTGTTYMTVVWTVPGVTAATYAAT